MAISRRKTGVARTMTWLGLMARILSRSGQGASGVNPDDGLHRALAQAAGHADHEIVQVDGRVAVARNQPKHPSDRRYAPAGTGRAQDAMLVAAIEIVQLAVGVQGQHL